MSSLGLDTAERRAIDSRPFQRLRHIHQLALTYLVYPGATHRRFEHSLGVMDLAGRVYDVITKDENLDDKTRGIVPSPGFDREYWRRVLRMAALCHDIGHLPFSHAAEKDLLPRGVSHETMSLALIRSEEMAEVWKAQKLGVEDVAKIAVGQRKYDRDDLDDWQAILSEIIVNDAFGVDRIDYLLRDSLHAGVAYGRFDHHRLIDCLRILPNASSKSDEPVLGVTEGGLHSAEALLLARYFMYMQLYLHPVRRAYDLHLKDFLASWLATGMFPTDLDAYLALTDNEVTAALLLADRDSSARGHEHARRIVGRQHFRKIYAASPEDRQIDREAGRKIADAAKQKLGAEFVRHDFVPAKSDPVQFPVVCHDGSVVSGYSRSTVLEKLPPASMDLVFVHPDKQEAAVAWLAKAKPEILPTPTDSAAEERRPH